MVATTSSITSTSTAAYSTPISLPMLSLPVPEEELVLELDPSQDTGVTSQAIGGLSFKMR